MGEEGKKRRDVHVLCLSNPIAQSIHSLTPNRFFLVLNRWINVISQVEKI